MMTTSVSVMGGSAFPVVIPVRVVDANPESRVSPMCDCTSEVWSCGPSRNDETNTSLPTLPVTLPYAPLPFPPSASCRIRRRSLYDFIRYVRPASPGPQPAGADRLHVRDLRQRAVVLGAAAVHQNGAAAARRLAGGVVCGDGVLPVAAARRLCLCALSDAAPQPPDSGGDPSRVAGDRVADAAVVGRGWLGRTAEPRQHH